MPDENRKSLPERCGIPLDDRLAKRSYLLALNFSLRPCSSFRRQPEVNVWHFPLALSHVFKCQTCITPARIVPNHVLSQNELEIEFVQPCVSLRRCAVTAKFS